MKNTGKGFKQTKQFTQFYQGTRGFFYGTTTGFIWYTQKVVLSSANRGQILTKLPKHGRRIVTLSA